MCVGLTAPGCLSVTCVLLFSCSRPHPCSIRWPGSAAMRNVPRSLWLRRARAYFLPITHPCGREAADSAGRSCAEIHLKRWPPSPGQWGQAQKSLAGYLNALARKYFVQVLLTAHWPKWAPRGLKEQTTQLGLVSC